MRESSPRALRAANPNTKLRRTVSTHKINFTSPKSSPNSPRRNCLKISVEKSSFPSSQTILASPYAGCDLANSSNLLCVGLRSPFRDESPRERSRFESLGNTAGKPRCRYCGKSLEPNAIWYYGNDMTYCSSDCRNELLVLSPSPKKRPRPIIQEVSQAAPLKCDSPACSPACSPVGLGVKGQRPKSPLFAIVIICLVLTIAPIGFIQLLLKIEAAWRNINAEH